MLTRICLIVAIVAGLLVAVLNFTKVKDTIIKLRSDLVSEISLKETALADAASTHKELTQTKKDLDSTKTELTSAQGERDKAVVEAENQTKRATQIADELTKTKQNLNDAQGEVAAWKAVGIGVDQIKSTLVELKQVKNERDSLIETNRAISIKMMALNNRIRRYEGDESPVELPANLQGKVLVADPKWDFVVLDVGQNQGVLEDGVLLVNRKGRLVAKVQVRSVQSDRSIANVMPNWKLGDVMEGDQVIP
jgi:cell shape-determining protein MreC